MYPPPPHNPSLSLLFLYCGRKHSRRLFLAIIQDTDAYSLQSLAKSDVTVLCNILMSVPDLKIDHKGLAPILGLSSAKNV